MIVKILVQVQVPDARADVGLNEAMQETAFLLIEAAVKDAFHTVPQAQVTCTREEVFVSIPVS
jgi:hypothetical protein